MILFSYHLYSIVTTNSTVDTELAEKQNMTELVNGFYKADNHIYKYLQVETFSQNPNNELCFRLKTGNVKVTLGQGN